MPADIYPIRGFDGLTLAIMPRPRAGDWLEDEVASWKRVGVQLVVSLLEPAEVRELGLEREAALCTAIGMEFHSFPIPDRGVPASAVAFEFFLVPLVGQLKQGTSVAVHCRAGIGRSALTAACMLARADVSMPKILPAISHARGLPVPDTEQQATWVLDFTSRKT